MELFMRFISVVFITVFALLLSACGGEGGGTDITRFTITSISGDGGSISPASVTVDENETTSFTITPDNNYIIDTLTGCEGALTLSENIFTTTVIISDCNLSVTFKLKSYAVTATAEPGGSISPAEQAVIQGETASFTLTPDPDYAIDSVTGCDGSLEGNTYSTAIVTQDCAVSASFKLIYAVTASAGQGGSISPAEQSVIQGETASFTLTPDPDYAIDSVTGCDGSLEGNTYSTAIVTQDCAIIAIFKPIYAVTASAGQGGSISPAEQSVIQGETASFTLTPDPDYAIDSVTGCDGSLEVNTYSTAIVTQDCAINAIFKPIYAVTASAGQGGSISPAEQSVIQGETASFTLTPDPDYAIDSVTGCDGSLEGNTYSTAIVTQDCAVSASFNQAPVANAGTDQTVIENMTVTLNGLASTDLEDDKSGTSLFYRWQQTDTTDINVALNDENLATPSFEAPSEAEATVLEFTLTVTDTNNDSGTDIVSITVNKNPSDTATGKLNDTGITACSSGSYPVSCPVTGYDGQDGERGRDAQAAAGTLTKVGAGSAGFDFTKLDVNGNALSASAAEWSCVQDNHTGLVWEVKTETAGLHHRLGQYTWYNTDASTHGGLEGSANNDSDTCYNYNSGDSDSFCNTQAFIARVNSQSLCGATNWRLPNRNELLLIVDFSIIANTRNSDYFPNTVGTWYWSSSPFASQTDDVAWYVNFHDGSGSSSSKSFDNYVRLVRGGK
jgi:hypothetical protein